MSDPDFVVAHDDWPAGLAVVPPIEQTSLFTFASFEEMRGVFAGETSRPVYSRGLNPTVRRFEEKIAALEGAEDCVALASGMAAISSVVLSLVSPGDRMVAVRDVYPDAFRLFETLLARFGVRTEYVDGRDPAAVAAALPGARVLYLESPTSFVFDALDVPRLAALAREAGAVSIMDNSWATPLLQRPVALGVDLVVHSASKYIGGHSDVVAGVVAGSAERIGRIRREVTPYLGPKLAPMEAWLLTRGLRTLPARLDRIAATAATVARRLAEHEAVTAIRFPGVTTALPPGLSGHSGLFSVAFDETVDIPRFCDALRIFRLGVSWGGHESLCVPALVTLGQTGGPNPGRFFGLDSRLVRLNIGLEGADALWSDLAQAITVGRTA